eukprot:TRINITY_DN2893_c0_g4_i1.p3 TRINITY_DN2893_c0_g4~~TRINITY_DN2893_c0_g4_i1.p3  ORF type:complete len:106 (-),score=14.56 TRINITY_DN2893_c0_g4_i1:47-364(-)
MKGNSRQGQFLERAFISQHLLECQSDTCPITSIQEEFYSDRGETLEKYIKPIALYIGKHFARALDRYPKSVRLRILYAEYLLKHLRSLPEAVSYTHLTLPTNREV